MMRVGSSRISLLVLGVMVLVTGTARAADDIRIERVQFAPGAASAIVEGSITGYEGVDYMLGAQAGQVMNVRLSTDNTSNYFNVIPPGEDDIAIFVGSSSGNQFEGTLPETGDYKVRIYLMRNAARRDETANYRLEMAIAAAEQSSNTTGVPANTIEKEDSLVAGTNYHATGEVPCSMGNGQPTGSCPFGVQRDGNGSGIVAVTKPDGISRAIFFEDGKAIGYDVSEADPGEFGAEKTSDLNVITIGDERYEIPDAVIFGG